VAVERAKFMDLVKREVQRLHETKYTDASATLLFTGGSLTAVRPEELPAEVGPEGGGGETRWWWASGAHQAA
jgi:hypothetical protein